ncbi:cation transporting ATPase C-terminal domain-containing protein [uncultured Tateyamaria sp.]|uniref:cation transporting ATPase C-terminal domain-containing protein n=1 Tax=uncultured Tateyamaria sp. TaxID=455651 RepID=UPI002608B6B7|nr:cation transporting ATPase C-terminal domain-containing protein [uncultured Tateyamaria sp.]
MLVLILIFATAIALSIGERVDALANGLVLILNAVLGFVQEWHAETALDALRSMLSPHTIMMNLIIGEPLIFLETQILLMNLIADSITAVALGLEKEGPDQMERPPTFGYSVHSCRLA